MKKVAIVTGAARGIGKACVKKLAKENIKVIANYNNSRKQAEELKKELQENGIEIDIIKADVSKREDVKAIVEFALKKYGHIDIIVNNARYIASETFYRVKR